MRTIAQIGAAYRDGSLTPTAVVAEAQTRIVERNPVLNVFADPMREASAKQAEMAERAFAKGEDLGPIHGIPVAIKDLIDVRGAPTGYGTRVIEPRIADADATLVARLRAAGAIILGKTQCLEFAYGVAHPSIGQTNNPADPARTAGGSSGGSAAAVADGIVPAAIGTDTGGSIRIPAAYCGIVGMKPSFGLVPLDGVFPLSRSLDHAGPMTRNVADAALILSCIAGKPMPLVPVGEIRFGVLRAHFPKEAANRDVSETVEAALDRLTGIARHDVEIPELVHANALLLDILMPEAALIHADFARANPSGYAPGTLAQIRAGATIPTVQYLAACEKQDRIRAAVEAAFENCDVLLSPSVPFTAPFEDPEIAEGGDSEMLVSGFANLTGHPSLSLPCGMANGLPVGLQLTGRRGGDAALLSIAASIEARLAN